MKLYLANSMFNNAEREWNRKLAAELRRMGYDVFLPQERDANVKARYQADPEEARDMIWKDDLQGVLQSDLVLAVLDGNTVDAGACIEIGIAWGQRLAAQSSGDTDYVRHIIGLNTDFRQWKPNLMISGCLDKLFRDELDCLHYLEELINERA